jgi:hypothetical protein
VTRTQFAVALAVLFAGGVVGGVLSDRVQGGTVAWAQEDEPPTQIDSLVVKRLLVLDSVLVKDEESSVVIAPGSLIASEGLLESCSVLSANGLEVRCGRSSASLWATDTIASLDLDSAGSGDMLADIRKRLETDDFSLQCSLSTHANGRSYFDVRSPGGKERVQLDCSPELGPHVSLMDRADNMRVTLGPNDNGTWQVGVWNADGRGRTLEAGF